MSWEPADPARAQARVVEIGTVVSDSLVEITDMLHGELVMRILELQGDTLLVELLRASVRSNIETLAHVVRYDVAVEDVATPFGAREYARRLAQNGISPTALIRAYRLGQHVFLEWAIAQLAELEDDPAVAYAAAQRLMGITFRYIDSISEQVVHDYEAEREVARAPQHGAGRRRAAAAVGGAGGRGRRRVRPRPPAGSVPPGCRPVGGRRPRPRAAR